MYLMFQRRSNQTSWYFSLPHESPLSRFRNRNETSCLLQYAGKLSLRCEGNDTSLDRRKLFTADISCTVITPDSGLVFGEDDVS